MSSQTPALLRTTNESDARPVLRAPNQLRLHPALDDIGWTGSVEELTQVARLSDRSVLEPILITSNGIVLAGFGLLRRAILEGKQEISCIEYPLGDDDALQVIITHHRSQRGWNDFVRIRLALRQKPDLQQTAVENMRAGGRCKGLTNLPKARRIDVRREIANIAGTGTGNISKVETILQQAHPNVIAALQNGLLKIHRAWKWCKFSKSEQKEAFARFEDERMRRSILRDMSVGPTKRAFDAMEVIEALKREQARQPGCIRIRTGSSMQTEIKIGQDLCLALGHQGG